MKTKHQQVMPDFNIIPEIDVKQKDTGKTIKQKVFLANFDNKVDNYNGRSRFDNKLNFIVKCKKATCFNDIVKPKISCSHFACDKNNNIHRAYFAGWIRNNGVNGIGFIFDIDGSDISVFGKTDLYLNDMNFPIMNFIMQNHSMYNKLINYKNNKQSFKEKAIGKKYYVIQDQNVLFRKPESDRIPYAKTFFVPKDNSIETKKQILGYFADADRRLQENVKKFVNIYKENYMSEMTNITILQGKELKQKLQEIEEKLNEEWHKINRSKNGKQYVVRGISIEKSENGKYNININNHMVDLNVKGEFKYATLPWSEFVLIPQKVSYYKKQFKNDEANPEKDEKLDDYEEFVLDEKNGEDKLLSSYGIVPVKTLVCDITNDKLKEDTINKNIYDIVEFQQGKNLPIIYTFKKVKKIYEFKPMLLSELIKEVKDRQRLVSDQEKHFRDEDMDKLFEETKNYEEQKIEEIFDNVAQGYNPDDATIHKDLTVRKDDVKLALQKLCKTDDIAIQIDYLLNNLQQVREGAKNISSQEEKDREKRIKQQEEFKKYKINCILKKKNDNDKSTENVKKIISKAINEGEKIHQARHYNMEFDRKILQKQEKNINKTISKIQKNISSTANLSKNRKSLNQ